MITIESERSATTQLSYARLRIDALAVAAGLIERGCGAGDAVAVMLPTGSEFFAAFYGALYAGCVPVPLYPPARLTQLEDHLQRSAGILCNAEARLLITVTQAKPLAHLLRARCETLDAVATVSDLAVPREQVTRPAISADSTVFLQYTSGSTGNPKGVVLSHANLLANVRAMWRASRISSADTFVSWLPLYHDMGLIGACIGSLFVGYRLVLMSPLEFLSKPSRWLWAIHDHRATVSAAPNFAYELCVNKLADADLDGLDLSSWRLAFNGAEPVSTDTIERFASRFARYGFRRESMFTVYGLAEGVLGVTFPPLERGPVIDSVDRAALMRDGFAKPARADDPNALRFVSCGVPLPGHEVRVVDGAHELAERAQGRVQFRGPSATRGYYKNPSANADLFADDWLNTGDLGYFAAGELYLTGREKDLIVRRGVNIHPAELEEAVANLPGVRKGGVAVFPATDRRTGSERLVVLAETRVTDAGERKQIVAAITRLAADRIGMPPDDVVLAPPRSVLKTSSGKIRRTMSRELYEQGALGRTQRAPWWQVTQARGPRRCRAGMAWRVGRGPYRVGLLGLVGLFDRERRRLADDDDPARRRPAPARGARVGAMRAQVVGDTRAGRRARTPAERERGGRRCQSRELCRFDPAHRGAAAAIRLRGQARAGHSGTARSAAAQTRRGVRREGRCGRRCRGHWSSRSACARRRTAGDVPRGDLQARARTASVQARSVRRRGAYRRTDHSGRAGRHALAAATR